jgi:hypothetical protein
MQIGWQEIVQTVIGGTLLYLVVEGIKLFIRRRKSKRERLEEKIAKLTAEIKQYEGWQKDKVGFLTGQVSKLTFTFVGVALLSTAFSLATGLLYLLDFLAPIPNNPILVLNSFLVIALWIGGSIALLIVASGVFSRTATLNRGEGYKKQLEEEIAELKKDL